MRIEKSLLGTKYVHAMTSSPFPFLGFLVLGLATLIIMASLIELDAINVYPASLDPGGRCLIVETNRDIHIGRAFAYANRNESMKDIKIVDVRNLAGKKYLEISEEDAASLMSLHGFLSIDVPSGKESLLHRVFAKGSKSGE